MFRLSYLLMNALMIEIYVLSRLCSLSVKIFASWWVYDITCKIVGANLQSYNILVQRCSFPAGIREIFGILYLFI